MVSAHAEVLPGGWCALEAPETAAAGALVRHHLFNFRHDFKGEASAAVKDARQCITLLVFLTAVHFF